MLQMLNSTIKYFRRGKKKKKHKTVKTIKNNYSTAFLIHVGMRQLPR